MNEVKFIEFLNKYSLKKEKVKLIKAVEDIIKAEIPAYWKKALLCVNANDSKKIILDEWKKYCGRELSITIEYLEKYLRGVYLICVEGEYSLIYNILSYRTGKDMFYEGRNPLFSRKLICEDLDIIWENIDKSLTDFYINLNNGFNDYRNKAMGLDSSDDIRSMADYDWYFIDEIDIDTKPLFNFFSNGMGTYVVLDTNKRTFDGGYLWSGKEVPKGGLNFWDYVDEWIVIGFDY